MATAQDLLFNIIRGNSGAFVTAANFLISNPTAIVGPQNTEVTFEPVVSGGVYAIQRFKYNRIDISALPEIKVKRGSATLMSELLPEISKVAGLLSEVDVSLDPDVNTYELLGLNIEDI